MEKLIISEVKKENFEKIKKSALENKCVKDGSKGLYAETRIYESEQIPDTIYRYHVSMCDVADRLNTAAANCIVPGASYLIYHILCDPNKKEQFNNMSELRDVDKANIAHNMDVIFSKKQRRNEYGT